VCTLPFDLSDGGIMPPAVQRLLCIVVLLVIVAAAAYAGWIGISNFSRIRV
jgi:hypothetical protein